MFDLPFPQTLLLWLWIILCPFSFILSFIAGIIETFLTLGWNYRYYITGFTFIKKEFNTGSLQDALSGFKTSNHGDTILIRKNVFNMWFTGSVVKNNYDKWVIVLRIPFSTFFLLSFFLFFPVAWGLIGDWNHALVLGGYMFIFIGIVLLFFFASWLLFWFKFRKLI